MEVELHTFGADGYLLLILSDPALTKNELNEVSSDPDAVIISPKPVHFLVSSRHMTLSTSSSESPIEIGDSRPPLRQVCAEVVVEIGDPGNPDRRVRAGGVLGRAASGWERGWDIP